MRRCFLLALLPLSLGIAVPAAAQMNYEAMYGPTIEVSVDNLLQMPEHYVDRAVRTRGTLEMIPNSGGQIAYGLQGTFGNYLWVVARSEVAYEWEQGSRRWVGKEVEVTGSISQTTNQAGQAVVAIGIWGYLGPPDDKVKKGPVSPDATLEEIVGHPEQFDGKNVNVKGQFRGENLFGDLPSASRARSSDWVIKEDLFAVWVTGKKPKGAGWSLDPSLKRDSGHWLQVSGRVRVANRVVTIEAVDVVLTKAPSAPGVAEAKPQPTPPPAPRPKRPPIVAFSLPLDGERDVARDTVFKVQFSRDMDEASLKDRVLLRYAGRPQPGDNALDQVHVTYDGGLRTLHIDPGDLLRPGRIVEVLLLPGIVDIDGVPLETRAGVKPGVAADVLRFQVLSAGLAGDPVR